MRFLTKHAMVARKARAHLVLIFAPPEKFVDIRTWPLLMLVRNPFSTRWRPGIAEVQIDSDKQAMLEWEHSFPLFMDELRDHSSRPTSKETNRTTGGGFDTPWHRIAPSSADLLLRCLRSMTCSLD